MKSLWIDDYDENRKTVELKENIDTDTVIVGGGLRNYVLICLRVWELIML